MLLMLLLSLLLLVLLFLIMYFRDVLILILKKSLWLLTAELPGLDGVVRVERRALALGVHGLHAEHVLVTLDQLVCRGRRVTDLLD